MARAALALPFSGLHGTLGDTVIVQLPDGPQVRRRVPVRKGRTPAQGAARERIEAVSRAWATLDEGAFQAWRRYARARAWRNPATGAIVTPRAYCLFCGLAAKARQVDPDLDLGAFMPPEGAFLGDGVALRLEVGRARAEDGVGSVAEGGSTPSLPSPRGESLAVRLAADRANAPGVVTELLVQPLANARRAVYGDKYVSRGFVAFEGAETVEVPLAAGAWALACRFVRAATGEETAILELGVVTVAR